MKALKPSHREKKRYLLLKGKDVSEKVINEAILRFVGELGFAKASPQGIKKNIFSINREAMNEVRASLLLSGKDITISKVSGTLKGLK